MYCRVHWRTKAGPRPNEGGALCPQSPLIPFLLNRKQNYSQYIKGHVWCIVGPWQTWKKSQACKRCLRTIFEKIVDIRINNNFLAVFNNQWPQISNISPQLIYFGLKISNALEKIVIWVNIIWLGNMWICGHFSIQKSGLQTKINFFHVCKLWTIFNNLKYF